MSLVTAMLVIKLHTFYISIFCPLYYKNKKTHNKLWWVLWWTVF